jgi:hypothetical protein
MKEPLYFQALKHSWALAFKHKLLWVFGIFALFLGQMGFMEFLFKALKAGSINTWSSKCMTFVSYFKDSGGFASFKMPWTSVPWAICLLIILFGLVAVFLFLAISSQGAIIKAAALYAKNDKKMPSVTTSWQAGVSHFWRLLGINLLKKLLIMCLTVFVGWGAWSAVTGSYSGWAVVIFFLIFLLAIIVGFALSFLTIYAAGYVVVEEYSFLKSLKASWRLFVDHWLVSVEVGLIIILTNVILFVILLVGFLVLFFPTLILWAVSFATAKVGLYLAGILIGLLLFTIYAVLVVAIHTVFTTSVWTYLFMKMHKHGLKSKIVHIFKK